MCNTHDAKTHSYTFTYSHTRWHTWHADEVSKLEDVMLHKLKKLCWNEAPSSRNAGRPGDHLFAPRLSCRHFPSGHQVLEQYPPSPRSNARPTLHYNNNCVRVWVSVWYTETPRGQHSQEINKVTALSWEINKNWKNETQIWHETDSKQKQKSQQQNHKNFLC